MANYWAITIGINQYRFLPPLSYAQRDAERMHEFLIRDAKLSPQRCWLISEQIATNFDPRFPTAQNIQSRITQCQQEIAPDDVLLCFFSGYGLQQQGQDYLLPIEADPRQIATTGIAVESLFKAFKAFPTPNIVLILDANRSQLGVEHGGFGAQTAQLAQDYNIAALLSCQPNQFSHEPLTLQQGIFTVALLSVLQDAGCLTLEQLVSGLKQRLPQLSEEYWRPRQDLLAVIPKNLNYQLILPNLVGKKSSADLASGQALFASSGGSLRQSMVFSKSFSLLSQIRSDLIQNMSQWLSPRSKAADASPMLAEPTPALTLAPASEPASLTESKAEPLGLSDEFFWQRLLVQGGLIAGILLFGVILRNSRALIDASDRTDSAATGQPSQLAAAPNAASSPSPASDPIPTDPALLMQTAQAAFQSQQYAEANRQLAQIPAPQRTPEQNQLLEQTNRELLNQAKTMLIRTREPRAENQVSDFVEAIKIARLIKPDQPLYQEVQQNLDRWSRVIMDMAQGRAERSNASSVIDAANNYSAAIAAARLVPSDQAKVYEQAQQGITFWSQKILDLANHQAQKGDLDLAIQIGELVPPNTTAYAAAQEAIASWRNQPAPDTGTSSEKSTSAPAAFKADPSESSIPKALAPEPSSSEPPAPEEPIPEPASEQPAEEPALATDPVEEPMPELSSSEPALEEPAPEEPAPEEPTSDLDSSDSAPSPDP